MALLLPLGVVYLWYPQNSDGVLFELGARRLSQGAVFYRDLWDIKQPGIYWIYQAGLALGLGVVGPRLLEVAGVLAGGVAVSRLIRGWALHPRVRVLAPALVLGSYLLLTHRGGVLAVEGLTNPLLVATVAASWPIAPAGGPARGMRGWFLAGVAAGAIGVLKLIYLPLPATVLIGALIVSRTTRAGRWARVAVAVAGAAVPLLAATGYFTVHGVLDLAWTTTVRVPLESVLAGVRDEKPWGNWLESLAGLGTLLVPLALAGLAGARRRGTVVRELTLLAVIAEALALAVAQYPTSYRLLVIVAPVGLLALAGADDVWRWAIARPRRVRTAVLVGAAVLALPMARGPERLLSAAPDIPSWGLGMAQRNARDAVLTVDDPAPDVAPVAGLVRPGDAIYVLGPPQVYQRLDAREAVEITGWASTLMPERVWRERDRELVRSRPRLVFIEDGVAGSVAAASPQLTAMLAASYTRIATTPHGIWYGTSQPGAPSGVPGDNQLSAAAP